MSWNYRVVRHATGLLALHEVYYTETGAPRARTAEPCGFISDEDEGLEGLVISLRRALSDAQMRPILDDAAFAEGDESGAG